MADHKRNLVIIVNGVPVEVERNANAPLLSVVEKALHESGNVGQPVESWEMRDAQGNILDPSRKIGDFDFPEGVKLFLSLKAGIGGLA
jgi:uncharacterized protein DUF2604